MNKYQDVIKDIDWNLLQKQKQSLEKLLTNLPPVFNKDINDLWGIIELIENLQDVTEIESNNIIHFQKMRKS